MNKETQLKEEIEEQIDFTKIKCPICGGSINCKWLDTGFSSNELICFVATCWNGNLYEDGPRHVFRIKIFNAPSVEVNYEDVKCQ